jgi:uncharacterized protein YndB with AHSA1/START domain
MIAEPAVAMCPGALAPIVIALVVPCAPARAFDYFTRDIGRWWPLATHSCGAAEAVDVAFEPRLGGQLVERTRSGSRHVWGDVTAWEPGSRIAFTWHPGREAATAQWVDVRFVEDGEGTRVTLTHGGWDRRDDGSVVRENYVTGWQLVLSQRYGGYCRAAVAAA